MREKKAIIFVFFVHNGENYFGSSLAFIAICAIIMNIKNGAQHHVGAFFFFKEVFAWMI